MGGAACARVHVGRAGRSIAVFPFQQYLGLICQYGMKKHEGFVGWPVARCGTGTNVPDFA